MDADRFDDVLRRLSEAASRRDVAWALASFALAAPIGAFLGVEGSDAKKKKGKKKKKKKCKGATKKCGKKCIPVDSCCPGCTGGQICQDGTCVAPPPFCTGKNVCANEDDLCHSSGSECGCFVTEGSGAPFCGQLTGEIITNCDQCGGDTCVDVSAGPVCGDNVACAIPCNNPR